jgi:hypothetical protein
MFAFGHLAHHPRIVASSVVALFGQSLISGSFERSLRGITRKPNRASFSASAKCAFFGVSQPLGWLACSAMRQKYGFPPPKKYLWIGRIVEKWISA